MASEYAESLRKKQPASSPTVVPKPKPKPKPKAAPVAATPAMPYYNPYDYNPYAQMTPTTPTTPVDKVPAFDIFKKQFESILPANDLGASWLKDLYKSSQKYYETTGYDTSKIPDYLLTDKDAPQSYKDRFKGIFALKAKKDSGVPIKYIPNVSEYIKMSEDMTATFQKYGLNTMANQDNIANIIGNDVDASEMQARMDNAFYAIDNADSYLKQQLSTFYPQASRAELASALLTGDKSSLELKKQVGTADITARANEFGITSAIDAGSIYDQGYSKADARSGFATSAVEQAGLQNAANIFGDVSSGLLTEQQTGNITGVQTQRVEGLRSKARAEFSKKSGVTENSLKKRQVGL